MDREINAGIRCEKALTLVASLIFSGHVKCPIENVVRYLADCFRAEYQRKAITDIFEKKIEKIHFPQSSEELLNGFFDYIWIHDEVGKEHLQHSEKYAEEKEYFYGALFICGTKRNDAGELVRLCGPLFLYSAQVVHEGHYRLMVNPGSRRINTSILEAAVGDVPQAVELMERIMELIPPGPLTLNSITTLTDLLNSSVVELETNPAYQFPLLCDKVGLRNARLERKQLTLHSGGCLFFTPKSRETRALVTELEVLASGREFSGPTRALFEGSTVERQEFTPKVRGYCPVNLSEAQNCIVESAAKNEVTIVEGPPGTGKSFTIAAIALTALSRGESVLITSKLNHAVDVVGRILEEELGCDDLMVRAGRKDYSKSLNNKIDNLLARNLPYGELKNHKARDIEKEIGTLERRLMKLEASIHSRNDLEESWGDVFDKNEKDEGWWQVIHKKWIQVRHGRLDSVCTKMSLWYDLQPKLYSTIRDFVRKRQLEKLEVFLDTKRLHLANFRKAIRARTGSRRELYFGKIEFDALFEVLPLWLCNLNAIAENLPNENGVFDTVLIDESSQIDLASIIPAIQRAKRVVIVGDSHQLRHISFLSRSQLTAFAKKHEVPEELRDTYDYRSVSLLDLAHERVSSAVYFLNEHFRSVPEIVAFSNRNFYRNRLLLMTELPQANKPNGLVLHSIQGVRTADGDNPIEAESLVEYLKKIIEAEQELSVASSQTIGILSPFRAQVSRIQNLIEQTVVPSMIEKHKIRCSTAHGFQGEERDVMLISLVVDKDTSSASLIYLDKPDVFNVSVTRARSEQHVFLSCSPYQLKSGSYWQRYLEGIESDSTTTEVDELSEKSFLSEVTEFLQNRGFSIFKNYSIAGQVIDILVVRSGKAPIGLDLLGGGGTVGEALNLEQISRYRRIGFRVFPVSRTDWLIRGNEARERLQRTLDSQG